MKKTTAILACALACGAALIVPNSTTAQTSSSNPRTKLVDSIAAIRPETVATRDQLQVSVKALKALTKQEKGDLQPTFDTYSKEVAKTHVVAERTAARYTSMQEKSQEYFAAWKTEISGIKNESLRNKAQKRMDAVLEEYNGVIKSLQDASEKFKPFLSDLDDVQKMLASDITPGGVKAVRGVASDASWNMNKVRSRLTDAIDELGDMEKSLSSETSN